jgi:hypothetical protein
VDEADRATTLATTSDRAPSHDVHDAEDPLHAPFLWTIAGLVIAALWVRPITSSLWNDELGTWWVIDDGLRQVVRRAEAVQGQSPLYYVVEWAARHLVGRSELGLRVPSLLFAIAAAWVTYLIAKRLADRETARLAVIAFAVWPSIAFAASDARPYALATLVVVTSTWALIRWLDSGRLIPAIAFVLSTAIVPYVHPIFGVVLFPQMIYAAARIRERSTVVRPRDVALAVVGVAVLVSPVAFELIALWRRREISSVPRSTTVSWLVEVLVPPAFVGGAAVAGILFLSRHPMRGDRRPLPRSTIALLVGWLVIPLALLVGLSIAWSIDLLEARYLLCITPAAVLVIAMAARSIEPPRARRIVVLAVVVLSVLDIAGPMKSGDLRGATQLAGSMSDAQTAVLITSGFQESVQESWFSDPGRKGLLTAGTSFYPVPGRITPLPAYLDPGTIDLVRSQVELAIAGSEKAVIVIPTGSAYEPWFDEYMRDHGWTAERTSRVSQFTVVEFVRGSP